MPQYAPEVVLSPRQRAILERIARSSSEQHRLVERARIVLGSADGRLCVDMASTMGVDEQRVRRWRKRFAEDMELLASAEAQDATDEDLHALIVDAIGDDPKSGGPPKFTPEDWAKLAALACEPPSKFGLPFTHWTPLDLSRHAAKMGIALISERHLARFLKGGGNQAAQVALLAQREDRRPGAARGGSRGGVRRVSRRRGSGA